MLKEFKEFAMRGNVMDLAVGVIIGAAFGKIVDSVVNDLIMPLVGRVLATSISVICIRPSPTRLRRGCRWRRQKSWGQFSPTVIS